MTRSRLRIRTRRKDLLPDAGFGRCELPGTRSPGNGLGRRKRCGQVHVDQRAGRSPDTRRRRDAVGRSALHAADPAGCGRSWHRRRASGVELIRQPEHRREPVSERTAQPPVAGDSPRRPPRTSAAGGRRAGDRWPASGSRHARRAVVARGTATGRNRPRGQCSTADRSSSTNQRSSLDQEQTQRLFGIISRLRDQGMAVIYISHSLGDVLRLSDSDCGSAGWPGASRAAGCQFHCQ